MYMYELYIHVEDHFPQKERAVGIGGREYLGRGYAHRNLEYGI